MEIKSSKLHFIGVDFPTVELRSLQPYGKGNDTKISIDIKPSYFLPEGEDNLFKIIMSADLSAENYFSLNIMVVGTFEIKKDGNVTKEERDSFINANSVAIVFPYLRAFIANFTSNLGNVTTPITLPARFFHGAVDEYTSIDSKSKSKSKKSVKANLSNAKKISIKK